MKTSRRRRSILTGLAVIGAVLVPTAASAQVATVDCDAATDDIAAVQSAVDGAADGSAVEIRGTCDFTPALAHGGDLTRIDAAAVVVRPGTPVNGLTITSVPGGDRAKILGSGTQTAFLVAPGNDGVTIKNLNFTNLARPIMVVNAKNTTIGDPGSVLTANQIIGDVTMDSAILAVAHGKAFTVKYGAGGVSSAGFPEPPYGVPALAGLKVLTNYINFTHPGTPDPGGTKDIVGIDVRQRHEAIAEGIEIKGNRVGMLTSEFPSFNMNAVRIHALNSSAGAPGGDGFYIRNVVIHGNSLGQPLKPLWSGGDEIAAGRAGIVLLRVGNFRVTRNGVRTRISPTGIPMPGGGIVVSDSANGEIGDNAVAVLADPSVLGADLGAIGVVDDLVRLFAGGGGPDTRRIVIRGNTVGQVTRDDLAVGAQRGILVNGASHVTVADNNVTFTSDKALLIGTEVQGPGSVTDPGPKTLAGAVTTSVLCGNSLDGTADDPAEIDFNASAGSTGDSFPGGVAQGNLECAPTAALAPAVIDAAHPGDSLTASGAGWAERPVRVVLSDSTAGQVEKTVTAAANGAYEAVFTAAELSVLADGVVCATATSRDDLSVAASAGSAPACAARDLSVPAAPVITSPVDGASLGSAYVQVKGTAEAGTTVAVFEGSARLGEGTTGSGVDFSVSIAIGIGSHTLFATASDSAGNQSGPSGPITVTITEGALNAHPHAEITSPAASEYRVVVGDGTSPVGVDVVWEQPLENAKQEPVEPVKDYFLLVARPWEFDRMYSERIPRSACTVVADPNAPDFERCTAHLDFPIALGGGDALTPDDKYAIGVTTIFADGHRSDGWCDNNEPRGVYCGYQVPGGTWPGYGYTEVLVESHPWRAYQGSDIATRASSPWDLVRDVLLVDPPSGKFEFIAWNFFDRAAIHRGVTTLQIPLGDRMLIVGGGGGVTIAGAYGPDDAQALVATTNPLADLQFFDGVRKS
ncbi:MAG: hypothetical protein HY775_12890 [Acidobacteria bacterium]|nr:hypothetical protein [Acidobacteriota bacterium]